MTAVDFSGFVDRLAQASADVILPFFRSAIGAEDKSGGGVFDPVTEADRAAEVVMRRLIGQAFPAHGIVGEEYGKDRADAEYVWVLDPIDGTKAFISGLPTWGTLIGLTHRGRPVYGMMSQPFTRERYFGDGASASCRGPAAVAPGVRGEGSAVRQLRVRPCASLASATLMTTTPKMFDETEAPAYRSVEEKVRLARYGADCYAYCMLAAGYIDIVIEANLKPHDIVALVPIVEGAGGIISTWDGGEAAAGGRIVAAGDRRVYEEALRLLAV
jgi:myo-inositol-1(or 4)-monophosphatase